MVRRSSNKQEVELTDEEAIAILNDAMRPKRNWQSRNGKSENADGPGSHVATHKKRDKGVLKALETAEKVLEHPDVYALRDKAWKTEHLVEIKNAILSLRANGRA